VIHDDDMKRFIEPWISSGRSRFHITTKLPMYACRIHGLQTGSWIFTFWVKIQEMFRGASAPHLRFWHLRMQKSPQRGKEKMEKSTMKLRYLPHAHAPKPTQYWKGSSTLGVKARPRLDMCNLLCYLTSWEKRAKNENSTQTVLVLGCVFLLQLL